MKKLSFNGKVYEMKNHTLAVTRKEDAMDSAVSREDACIKIMDYVIEVLGDEVVAEILGSNDIEEVDTKDLEMLANAIGFAYEEDILKQQKKAAENAANSVALDKLIKSGEAAATFERIKSKKK